MIFPNVTAITVLNHFVNWSAILWYLHGNVFRKLFQITVYWSANSRYLPATMICIQFVTCSINKLEIHLHTIHSNQNTLTVFNKYTWYTVIYPMWFYWNVQIIWKVIIHDSWVTQYESYHRATGQTELVRHLGQLVIGTVW